MHILSCAVGAVLATMSADVWLGSGAGEVSHWTLRSRLE